MTFSSPLGLLMLLVVPALVAAYLRQRRKTRAGALRFSNVALVKTAVLKRSRWRRLLPMILFLVGLGSLGVASARPKASIVVPTARTSIILAMDVSRSMCATDVKPNRLVVAQAAARKFVQSQPKGTRLGIVAFAGFAELVVAPTDDQAALIAAIDGFTTARGTAIGAATLAAIDALAGMNPDIAPIGLDPIAGGTVDDGAVDDGAVDDGAVDGSGGADTSKEEYVPDIVVLLTDGANTRGIEPIEAAAEAVARKVRVYTIGFGTTNPTETSCTAQQLGGDAFAGNFGNGNGISNGGGFGGGSGRGGRRFLTIDEPTLQEVADLTGAQYYRAEDADQLGKVFASLPKDVVLQRQNLEVSAIFAAISAMLTAFAIALSMRWNRPP